MKILLTGGSGQLGWELQRAVPTTHHLMATDVDTLDVTDTDAVLAMVESEQPDWIINASAYTAVDKAETDKELAYAINRDGAGNLAKAASTFKAKLLHISTDFVFNGTQGAPYQTNDKLDPLAVYGASKLEGENLVQKEADDNFMIIRTAWLYSSHGQNFVKTMLRLMNERDVISVVEDQIGTPSHAAELAKVIYSSIDVDLRGIFHWTDSGVASWFDFAQVIYQLGRQSGMIEQDIMIKPIPTKAYPTPAQRPANSVLDKSALREAIGYDGLHWQKALNNMMKELIND